MKGGPQITRSSRKSYHRRETRSQLEQFLSWTNWRRTKSHAKVEAHPTLAETSNLPSNRAKTSANGHLNFCSRKTIRNIRTIKLTRILLSQSWAIVRSVGQITSRRLWPEFLNQLRKWRASRHFSLCSAKFLKSNSLARFDHLRLKESANLRWPCDATSVWESVSRTKINS